MVPVQTVGPDTVQVQVQLDLDQFLDHINSSTYISSKTFLIILKLTCVHNILACSYLKIKREGECTKFKFVSNKSKKSRFLFDLKS